MREKSIPLFVILLIAIVHLAYASSVSIVGKDLNVYEGNIIINGKIIGSSGTVTIDSNLIVKKNTTTETLYANSASISATAAIYGSLVLSNLQSCGYLYTDAGGTVQCSTLPIVGGSGDTNYLAKWTSNTSIGSATIYDSGKGIGIFTSAPQYELDVNGTTRSTNILATTITTYGTIYADTVDAGQYLVSGTTVITADRNITNINSITAAGPMNIDSGTLYVDSANSRVGIGTTAPGYKLDVSGAVRASSFRTTAGAVEVLRRAAGTADFLICSQDGTGRVQFYWNVPSCGTSPTYQTSNEPAAKILWHPFSGTGFVLYYAPAGTAGSAITWQERFRVDLANNYVYIPGSLGIGTTPSYKLDVSGTARITDIVCTDCISLGTETSGNYVAGIVEGNGISISGGTGEGTTATISVKAGTGLSFDTDGNLVVVYGSTAGTAVEGSTKISILPGSGLAGGGTITLGSGGSVTLSHADTSAQPSVDNTGGIVIQDINVDIFGHVTGIGSVNLDPRYINTGEAAGGDLSGTYPNPTVVAIQGFPIATTTPTTGQVLKWNGTQWAPAADEVGVTGSGTTGHIPKWTGASSLGDSLIYDSGTGIGIKTETPAYELDVNGYANASALCIGGNCITDWSQAKKGVVIELRCGAGFYSSGSVATGCTAPPSCPTGWTQIGTGTEWLYYTSYYYGNQVSVCYSDAYSECIRLRCGAAFYTSGGTAYGCSSPPSCPAGWTAVASDYAFIDYTGSYHEGYREVWCCR